MRTLVNKKSGRPRRGVNLVLLNDILPTADHVDVKTLRTTASLREVIAATLAYHPTWVDFLVRVRGVVAKILGLKHEDTGALPIPPAQVPFQPGETMTVFTVAQAKEDEYWIAELMEDKHLQAWVALLAEPVASGNSPAVRGYAFVTVVRYKHWTGRLYFNLIRPFHHLIVWTAARHAERRFASR